MLTGDNDISRLDCSLLERNREIFRFAQAFEGFTETPRAIVSNPATVWFWSRGDRL
jgi:hypothetical protein